jgi:hypothetical protein
MDEREKRLPGRPKTGRTRPHEVHAYLNNGESDLLEGLKRRTGEGPSALVRRLIREEAARLGIEGGSK